MVKLLGEVVLNFFSVEERTPRLIMSKKKKKKPHFLRSMAIITMLGVTPLK